MLLIADIEETLLGMTTPAVVLKPLPGNEFRIQSLNRATQDLLGARISDPVGQTLKEIPFRSDAGIVLQSLAEQTLTKRTTQVFESSIARLEDGPLYLSTTWVPIIESDQVVAIVLTIEDVTELVSLRMQRSRELSLFVSGFIKVCAWCGRVRDQDQWRSASDYAAEHDQSNAEVCPDCAGDNSSA